MLTMADRVVIILYLPGMQDVVGTEVGDAVGAHVGDGVGAGVGWTVGAEVVGAGVGIDVGIPEMIFMTARSTASATPPS
jgi:hypothetical protein